jgi:glycyl-tRNA synthetase beta chain
VAPATVLAEVAPAEQQLHDAFAALRGRLGELAGRGDYAAAFAALAGFTPVLAKYFEDVFVMADEPAVRDNRLRLMRAISETCSTLASLQLLGVPAAE